MEQNKLIQEIISNEKTERLTWKELDRRFTDLNEIRGEPIGTEYALIEFDYEQMPNPDYRTENQRYWLIRSDSKVFQSWAGGYSLFAYCIGDKNTDRMERIFNSTRVKNAYIITQEQRNELYK
jgi:hypothetical protein